MFINTIYLKMITPASEVSEEHNNILFTIQNLTAE